MDLRDYLKDPRLDLNLLDEYRFDRARFRADLTAIRSGRATRSASVVGRIEPVCAIEDLVGDDEKQAQERRLAGVDALRLGRVAVLLLNGGMATRFGGIVKGAVEVFDGRSFLELAAYGVSVASMRYGAPIPLVIMNSFATRKSTCAHLAERKNLGLPRDELLLFEQSISIRLDPAGDLFISRDGMPSYHVPGHGDCLESIRASGTLARLRERGILWILLSNVDNLGATIDPLVLGHHILSGRAMTCEVTEKRRSSNGDWDRGGSPATVDGRLCIIEGFRFPVSFAQESLPDISTNNMIFTTAELDRAPCLPRWAVEKDVDGRVAIQFESILCEAGGVPDARGDENLSLHLVRVPRDGASGRFFPIKQPDDLDALRDGIKARLEHGWAAPRQDMWLHK